MKSNNSEISQEFHCDISEISVEFFTRISIYNINVSETSREFHCDITEIQLKHSTEIY